MSKKIKGLAGALIYFSATLALADPPPLTPFEDAVRRFEGVLSDGKFSMQQTGAIRCSGTSSTGGMVIITKLQDFAFEATTVITPPAQVITFITDPGSSDSSTIGAAAKALNRYVREKYLTCGQI